MQPDRSRRSYPAFRAWVLRQVGYVAVAMAGAMAAVVVVASLLPGGLPGPLRLAAMLATALGAGLVADHVVAMLLHDRREAAGRELGLEPGRRTTGCDREG